MKENKNVKLALEWSIIKWLFFLSLPILIWNLLQSSYNLVDAYWISKISKEAVASISASIPIIFLVISIWTGFSMAGTILIAQYAWAKNQKMVNKTASQTLTVDIFLALFLWILWFFSSEFILELIKIEKSVMEHAVPYMRIIFLGLIFSFIFSMFQSIMRWVWENKLPMNIILGTVILNFIIDPILILGFWPIPAMWVTWAAIATVIAQFISALIWLFILFKWNYGVKINLADMKPDFSFIKKIFFLWLPSSVEMSIRSLWFVLLTWLVTYFWTVALAWFWAAWNIFQLIFIPTMWFSIAISTMVWQNIWAKNFKRAREIAKTWAFITFIILEIIWIFIFFLAPFLVGIFVKDAETIKVWADLLKISSLTFWIMWIQFALTWVFRAAWNTSLAMNLWIFSMFVVQLPVAYILSKHLEWWINWVWWSFVITNIIMALICIFIYTKWDWEKKKITTEEKLEEKVMEETIISENKV